MSDKCFACHGFDEETREADLRLDTQEGAYEDLGGYAAIEPGNAEKSEVYLRLITKDEDDVMPPAEAHKTISPAEIALIKEWINEGAKYEEHWAYQPVKKAEVPEGHEIDFLIAGRQKEAGLEPSGEAARTVLLRRISWDLRGVPPTAEEVQEFLGDESPEAFEKWVDRFMADPKYGERMAVWWLDLVRYADTIGYHSDNEMKVTPYRDYVIKAFNENKSFADFTIEQLAGDLLPEATLEQRIASGYNRLLQTSEEGGAQEKEYRAIYAADRVRNVSEVWMGSTVGCAQCHDHKFDPFTAYDFHALAAFFDDIKERGVGKRDPNLVVPSAAEATRVAELEKMIREGQVAHMLAKDAAFKKRVEDGRRAWLESQAVPDFGWRPVTVSDLKAPAGTTLNPQADGSILEGGKVADFPSYSFKVASPGTVTGLRLEAMNDAGFATKGGFTRGNGNFVLTGVEVKKDGKSLKISRVVADVEQSGYPAKAALDGKKESGWAVGAHQAEGRQGMRQILFQLETPLELKEDETLELSLHYQSAHAKHSIGRFRVSASAAPEPGLKMSEVPSTAVLAALKSSERSPEDEKLLADYYEKISPEIAAQNKEVAKLEGELKAVRDGMRRMLVAEALPTPRMTRVLPRGNWLDETGEVVQPAVPVFLQKHGWQVEGRASRLDLAKWILDKDNPLTGRTVMNRLWRLYFGRGIAKNVTDLGGQGTMPSHPELLDWLAADLRDGDWDIKRMVKKIVTSKAYRQKSEVSSFLREKDPANDLYTRQGRWRVEAEFVRDAALSVAGILHAEVQGGESVKPYQPAGYWQHLNFPKKTWKASSGDDLYRRSVYTFWCRTFLHPSMVAFDAPSREECTAERARSNIPQQALAMLNDPIFVEAARVFGERMVSREGSTRDRLAWGMMTAFSREATEEELDLLEDLLEKQRERFENDAEAAKAVLTVGEWKADPAIPVNEAAAWAQVGRAILNAYETTSRF
ncbi:PSD1 and planctomycete cytochrome C domain-containing protein [Verrucomicrobiaceae bacterium 227]